MSNFVAISRTNGSINELSLLVEDISSLQLYQESATVVIYMRSGKEFSYAFNDPDKATTFYKLVSDEVASSGRALTQIDVDDFDPH